MNKLGTYCVLHYARKVIIRNMCVLSSENKTQDPLDAFSAEVKGAKKKKKQSQRKLDKISVSSLDQELQSLIYRFPKLLGKKTVNPVNLYHVHSVPVGMLLKTITDDECNKDAVIFEANPGPGVLTKALLNSGVQKLRVFEKTPEFIGELTTLLTQYPTQLDLVKEDILKLPTIAARDSFKGTNSLEYILKDVKPRPWNEDPPLKVIATLSRAKEISFLRFLLRMIPYGSSLFSVGRTELLLFVTGLEYLYMTSTKDDLLKKYRSTTILYSLMFDIEILGKVPKLLFLPVQRKTLEIPKRKLVYDQQNMYLVRLTPKQDIFEVVHPPERLPELAFFVRQHMMKPTAYIIPSLEKWVPRSGPRLIREGIPVFTKFGDLSPREFLNLFLLFSSWSEYKDSTFYAAYTRDIEDCEEASHTDDEAGDES